MKWFFAVLLLFMGTATFAGEKYLFDSAQNGFVKLLPFGKDQYVITANRLYKVGRKKLELKAVFPFSCADACAYQTGIALATDSGLVFYSIEHEVLKKLVPEPNGQPVNSVVQDAQKRLWFSRPHEGAYVVENGKAELKIQAPAVYAVASTPDSNVWVGTNVGLYKVPATGGDAFRYAEEGIEGFELPDNLVERLFPDDASNVWALLPDGMAFIPGKNESDIPSYGYPGGSENKPFCIAKSPTGAKAFFLATAQGVFYTQDLKGMETVHSGEIHQTFQETAYQLQDALLEKPLELSGAPVVSIVASKNEVWFVTGRGVWHVSTQKLVKRLQAKS